MHTRRVFVSISAVTKEYQFAALDGHRGDTYETLHNVELILHTSLTILSIEITFTMIHALIHDATVLHTLILFRKGLEAHIFNIPHHGSGGDEDTHSCGASQIHSQSRRSKSGDSLSKRFVFATRVKEFHVIGPYFTDVLRCFTV